MFWNRATGSNSGKDDDVQTYLNKWTLVSNSWFICARRDLLWQNAYSVLYKSNLKNKTSITEIGKEE